jgi:hypothetical protein
MVIAPPTRILGEIISTPHIVGEIHHKVGVTSKTTTHFQKTSGS